MAVLVAVLLTAFYIVLGCFLDRISMVVLTACASAAFDDAGRPITKNSVSKTGTLSAQK